MGIPDWIRDKAVMMAMTTADDKLDMYEAGKQADVKLDLSPIGEKNSEKLQRGLITDKFLDFLRGLWDEDPDAWIERLLEEDHKLNGGK